MFKVESRFNSFNHSEIFYNWMKNEKSGIYSKPVFYINKEKLFTL